MKKFFLILTTVLAQSTFAQIEVNKGKFTWETSFPVVTCGRESASILYDRNDFRPVGTAVGMLAEDIKRTTDADMPIINSIPQKAKSLIVAGTIGKSHFIDMLEKSGKLNTDTIAGQWERFIIKTVENPFDGVDKALVIAGSDKRGTAYGITTVCKAIGVSPWHFWSDVPVKKQSQLYLQKTNYISKSPSVKYRGIFINDEDWGLHPWAGKNMDKTVGDIGPNTYEKVFELMLRLKANMVAPAMHECTKAFYTVAGNMEKADEYGIMMTTSHCEPLMYNNASEWDEKVHGEWDYRTNRSEIDKVLDERVAQAGKMENIYTIALRGKHDSGMKGSMEEKFQLLGSAIESQRGILKKHIDKPIEEIPQIFVPYKEVLDIYEKGLKVPEDITIVWPDDNYGYIKKLSNADERKREGGSGVYYHISYLGWPNDYLWLNTTSPALMYAEMQKAWSLGADRYWLLNAGDIKPGELGVQLFLDMAWDFDSFTFENVNEHNADFLASIFGKDYEEEFAYILDRYYHLAFERKPEYMTWDWRWNSLFADTKIKDTEFSFANYREAENRMEEYADIAGRTDKIMSKLSEELRPAFFELLYYPVKASYFYNMEMLTAQQNRWYATQGRAMTNLLADRAVAYHDSVADITEKFNNLKDGKWDGIITAPGFVPKKKYAPTKHIELTDKADMGVFVDGGKADAKENNLPCFYETSDRKHYIDVYNKCSTPMTWSAKADEEWIRLNVDGGTTDTQERIWVSIDWSKCSNKKDLEGEIVVKGGKQKWRIGVKAVRKDKDAYGYVEENGAISIVPTKYQRKTENGNIVFQNINGLGYTNSALQLGNARYDEGEGSFVEYDFHTDSTDSLTVVTYMLPLFPKDKMHGTEYGIQIDNQKIAIQSNNPKEYSNEWARNVLRNSAVNYTKFAPAKPGQHTLRIYAKDPGLIIHKIVIDCGGMKKSYTGPKESPFL